MGQNTFLKDYYEGTKEQPEISRNWGIFNLLKNETHCVRSKFIWLFLWRHTSVHVARDGLNSSKKSVTDLRYHTSEFRPEKLEIERRNCNREEASEGEELSLYINYPSVFNVLKERKRLSPQNSIHTENILEN